jgi:hypothetical protein
VVDKAGAPVADERGQGVLDGRRVDADPGQVRGRTIALVAMKDRRAMKPRIANSPNSECTTGFSGVDSVLSISFSRPKSKKIVNMMITTTQQKVTRPTTRSTCCEICDQLAYLDVSEPRPHALLMPTLPLRTRKEIVADRLQW